jgi:hypothetical protein
MSKKEKIDYAHMEAEAEIHAMESNVKVWKEVSIPKFITSIKYFAKELADGEIEVARLECKIAAKKKELKAIEGE